MGGTGTITNRGVTTPRYLVDIDGKPLFIRALEGVTNSHRVHILMRRTDFNKFRVWNILKQSGIEANPIMIDAPMSGAAHTALMAAKHINNEDPTVILTPEHIANFKIDLLPYVADRFEARGLVVVAEKIGCGDPLFWVKLKQDGKNPASVNYLTVESCVETYPVAGIYYWHFGYDFIKYAARVIEKERKFRGKYHIPMVFNEAVLDGLEVQVYGVKKTWFIQRSSHAKQYEEAIQK